VIIRTLAELQGADAASLKLAPWGLGRMKAEDAARVWQEQVARYDLSTQVPQARRLAFERVRTIFSYGVLCFDLYTVAGDQARLSIEQALRDRFLPFYNGTVPFTDAQQQPQSITAATYEEFYKELHAGGRLRRPKSWKLQPVSGRSAMRFDGMLDSLLRWARVEGLLAGQRDRIRDRPRLDLRNFAAHPAYHLEMPHDAEAEIADLAAIINRLWGAPSGAPQARELMIVAWDQRGVMWGRADGFDSAPLAEPATCVVVLAIPHDLGVRGTDLGSYDSLYETTATPAQYLWGPGDIPGALGWLQAVHPSGDEIQVLDRLFALRFDNSRLYVPQSLPVAAGLSPAQTTGSWYLIRADSPVDAFSHQRQLLAGVDGHSGSGHCECPVETLGEGPLQNVLGLAAAAGVSVTSVIVPDIRVPMSREPRCNRILGNGAWDAPPDDPAMVGLLRRSR